MAAPDARHLMVASALTYAKRWGWKVFPLYEIGADGHCTCRDGKDCGSPGKHPRVRRGFRQATTDPDQIKRWWEQWPDAGIGIACGASGLVVVDVDPRNGGDESMGELEATHGRLPETPRQCTGGGGVHELFRAPPGDPIATKTLATGVDLKADGGYIVAAPTLHVSGRRYSWDVGARPDETPLADLPQWIVDRVQRRATPPAASTGEVATSFLGAAFAAAGWLGRQTASGKAPVQCPWEDEHTTGKRFDSSTVLFAGPVGKFYCSHSHCAHRTLEDVLAQLPEDAKRKARERLDLASDYDPVTARVAPTTREWMAALRYTDKGGLSKDVGNAALILGNHEDWAGVLTYDAFADRIYWSRPTPQVPGLRSPRVGEPLADADLTFIHHWLVKHQGLSVAKTAVADACEAAARSHETHPLREYVSLLEWDGVPRVDTWLSRYLGTEDTEYHRLVGRWWLVSAIARALLPGCQADHVLVLEGPQGARKSTACRILGGDWYLGKLPSLRRDSDEPARRIQGHWIVEIGELDALRGAPASQVKDFLTQTVDVYRRPYARLDVSRPRSCVFIGTTNLDEYLTDPTGARRFWPARVGQIDHTALADDRDQLFAEARQLFESGERWWPEGEGVVAELAEEQGARQESDAWEQRIAAWVRARQDPFTVGDVLGSALGLEPAKWDRSAQTRAGAVLRHMGVRKRRASQHGARVWVYELSNLGGWPT